MSFTVTHPGVLCLLQDSGRRGYHRLGLTTGGPLDREAYIYCNRLLGNSPNATVIEISAGGLQLTAQTDTYICLTGAPMPLLINGEEQDGWAVHPVHAGDAISIGFTRRGCRSYLGVAQGFCVPHSFGSSATVTREGIGGLRGESLCAGDVLNCPTVTSQPLLYLSPSVQPRYQNSLTVRVIPGYQQQLFNRREQRRFFGSAFRVSEHCDRMGYRLEGPTIHCEAEGILSEGICAGAIQLPPDGQPIVLLSDRQTIGGYPKIGSALSLDTSRLAQLTPGATVHFAAISPDTAQRALDLAQRFTLSRPLKERSV